MLKGFWCYLIKDLNGDGARSVLSPPGAIAVVQYLG
jgi:hypothetical protein